jgi:DNA-binding CsgD family transcriptional regulator
VKEEWPLVGRGPELGLITKVVTSSRYRGLVVAGAAGVGKSRLASDALRLAEEQGCATARVTATRAGAHLPFGAVAPFLPAIDGGRAGEVDDRVDLLRRSAAALLQRAGTRRLIVFVDDAQYLDDASATLIHQLAATEAACIIATVRTGDPAPEPVTALWKEDLADRLELMGLDAEAIGELLPAVLGGPVDPAAVAHLVVRCQGNVLFLRELVLGALRDHTLQDAGGLWRLVGPLSPSHRLVELVEARLGGLTGDERALLELVSYGEPFGQAELAALSDVDLAESLERRGLLDSRSDGRRLTIHLAHPLYGDVLRARIPVVRVRSIARSLAQIVESSGARRREDVLRVATWRLEGGGAAPELLFAAAAAARWHYDFPLAERLARAAVEAGAGFEARLLAAQLASLQGHGEMAEQDLVALAREASDDMQRGLVAVTRLDNLGLYMGRLEEGLAVAEEAEATLQDPAWRDELAARRSTLLIGTEGPRVAAQIASPLLERAEGRALVWACLVAGFSFGRLGAFGAASDAALRGHAGHVTLEQPLEWYPWMHHFVRCQALTFSGQLAEALELATEQYRMGLADRSPEAQAWFAWQLSRVFAAKGHIEPAVSHAREAVALFRQLGRTQSLQFCLPSLALALAVGGRADDAADALRDFDGLGLSPSLFMGVDPLEARAWTTAAAGDLPRAHQILKDAVHQGETIGDIVGQASCLHTLARLGHPEEAAPRLEALLPNIEGTLTAARAAHAAALSAGDPDSLSEAADAFETMGADLLAAEAAADAAVAWRRRKEPQPAATCELRAQGLAARCLGAATPALRGLAGRPTLTRSEREAAFLAAAGRSNKEIAEQLVLSVRTVEGRLQRVYEKLGVAGRSELTSTLEALRPD